TCLTMKVLFGMALRQTAGLVEGGRPAIRKFGQERPSKVQSQVSFRIRPRHLQMAASDREFLRKTEGVQRHCDAVLQDRHQLPRIHSHRRNRHQNTMNVNNP
ncbi:hypothetical protein ABNX41_21810, partial [Rhodobacteraceae bacterium PA1-206B]